MRRSMIALLSMSASTLALAFPVHAQTAPAAVDDAAQVVPDNNEDPIVVIGTRARDRTVAQSAVPIDVIAGDALVQSGYTETNKLLNQLVPSFNFPQPSITDGTDVVRPATLRGLSPDQTLVLVNGKRRHTTALLNLNGSVGRGSAAVDLNTIPALAIDRIDVLRDGAASQYGSDAIAGVINIQLKKRPGGRAQMTYGKYVTSLSGVSDVTGVQTGPGGRPVIRASDGTLVLNETGKDLKVRDGETITFAANIGLPVGESGYLNFTGEYRDSDGTNRSGFDPRRNFPIVGFVDPQDRTFDPDPRELTFNRRNHRYGDAATKDMNFFVNGGVDLTPDAELYIFGNYGIRDGESGAFYRRAAGADQFFPATISDVRNCNWASGACVPFDADGFLPLITSEVEDYSAAVGVRGDTGGFHYDLSYVYGHNAFDFTIQDTYNTSFGPASLRSIYAGGTRFGQQTVNLDLQRDIDIGIKSLSLAFGGEYRNENYRVIPGSLQSYAAGPFSAPPFLAPAGAQGFPGFKPANAADVSRHSVAGYLELDADLSDAFSVQAAGRYEHFSDFGDTANGKLAARFAPVDWAAIRGSISTGFRAPSLQQQFFSSFATNNVNGTLVEIGTFAVADPVARALGAQPLKAEKSLNIGGGVTFTPGHGFTLTADYYNIKIDDRILLTENLQGAAVVSVLTAAGITSITSARFFINGIDTRTQGVEAVATYRAPDFGAGKFTLTAGYNYNTTKITSRSILSPIPGLTLFGRQETLRLEQGQPRTKINLGLDWSMGIVGATVRTNRYGETLSPGAVVANDVILQPKWITDAEIRLTPGQFEVAIGANNLFDIYPTRNPTNGTAAQINNYFIPYSSFSPFGFNGRYLYARVGVKF
ncbi:TonB-dependent receptor plug domain-containing protein [Sphingomonas sp.]|uniref:TonB-dependent receptor plug domain-containing protein n=1 Tax=Sphingomonas sp. TaxID=28214 RepID=UPI003D6C7077